MGLRVDSIRVTLPPSPLPASKTIELLKEARDAFATDVYYSVFHAEAVDAEPGQVLEMTGKAERGVKHHVKNLGMRVTGASAADGNGASMAREILHSGEAAKKFWEIARAQGGSGPIKSEDIKLGEYTHEVVAEPGMSGKIDVISNREIVKVARALGTPFIKEAGIYLEKVRGDQVREGDVLMTLYATSPDRLELGKKALDRGRMWQLVQ